MCYKQNGLSAEQKHMRTGEQARRLAKIAAEKKAVRNAKVVLISKGKIEWRGKAAIRQFEARRKKREQEGI
ncbi:MAG: hypothetical protein M0R03_19405 [Novosphingobium sp.]|nr:hypothetical protein [Novosphingobium sp.]